ncbi:MAG: adenylosuccinate synthase [Mariprofundaceae bacterium]|nr:adenylosuccinate synthase [Mariprofundaceae bacterium]
MKNTIAIGIQWGDEGKGKIVDLLAPQADVVARFQGGPNAGHTLIIGEKKTVLHHIPSGILHDHTLCLIGNGTVVDAAALHDEITLLQKAGVPVHERLRISDRCQLILPYHLALDAAREVARGNARIGTTGRGIGPCYEDKACRRGIRLCDLNAANLDERITNNLHYMNFILTGFLHAEPVKREEVEAALELARIHVLPLVADVAQLLHAQQKANACILFEGAQGTMLDIDHGTYPFVTSSNTVAGAALAGLGVGPNAADEILGIAKAYMTRVGAGPFPTELYNADGMEDAAGKHMAEVGHEFGSTTGRPRRTGWFDAMVTRHAVRINGITSLAITKLDVLDGLDEVKLCVGYRINGETIDTIPADAAVFDACEPIYETMAGWKASTFGATHMAQLPTAAQSFLRRIAVVCEAPIRMVSTGPDREHICHC